MSEVRFVCTEVRAIGDGYDTPMAIEGYAAKFNSESNDLGGFTEFVMPGAFARSLANNADVRCLQNHDPNKVLGRTKSKTLQVREDAVGLWFHADLPNTTVARDLHTLVGRGDVDQCSFAFTVDKAGQIWKEEKNAAGEWVIKRYLKEVELADVSAVTYPAYEDTVVYARSLAETMKNEGFLECRSRVAQRQVEDAEAAVAASTEAAKIAAAGEAERAEAASKEPPVETRPYSSPSDAPDHVPADKKAQWVEVFNSVFKKAIADGKSKDDADKEAFTQANGVAKRDEETEMKNERGMTGDTSYSELQSMLCAALSEKYGCDTNGFSKYWLQEVFDSYVIACCCEDGRLCKIPYTTVDPDNDNDVDGVELGEPMWVDVVYVPETEENSQKSTFGKHTVAHRGFMHDMGFGPDEDDDDNEENAMNTCRCEHCSTEPATEEKPFAETCTNVNCEKCAMAKQKAADEAMAARSDELNRQIRALTVRIQLTDPTFRGVPDQPRQEGGLFDSGPSHLVSAADHVSRMNAHDAEARVSHAYTHARAAIAHYEAAVNPSADASAKAKEASARCMGM